MGVDKMRDINVKPGVTAASGRETDTYTTFMKKGHAPTNVCSGYLPYRAARDVAYAAWGSHFSAKLVISVAVHRITVTFR